MIKCGECSDFPIFKCINCTKLLCTYHSSKHKRKTSQSHQIQDYFNISKLHEILTQRLSKLSDLRSSINQTTRSYSLSLLEQHNKLTKIINSLEKKYKKLFTAQDMNKIEMQEAIEILQSDLKIFSCQSKSPLKYLNSLKIEEVPLKLNKKQSWLQLQKFSDLRLKHSSKVLYIGFSPDTKYFVSSSDDRILRFWNLKKMKLVSEARVGYEVNAFVFVGDKNQIVTVGQGGQIEKYDLRTGIRVMGVKGHDFNVCAVDIDSKEECFITASKDCTVKMWDLLTFNQRSCFAGHEDSVFCAKFTSDDQFIVSGSFDKTIIIWDHKNSALKGKLEGHSGSVYSLEVGLNPKIIISGAADGQVIVWDIIRMTEKIVLKGHSNIVYSLKISRNNKFLFSGSADGKVIVWDLENNKSDHEVSNDSVVACIAVDASGVMLAYGMEDGCIKCERMG